MKPTSSRRDRAPDTPSPIASGADLRRSRVRTLLMYGGVWAALATGPLALAVAVAVPQMASSAPAAAAAAPLVIAPPTGYAESFVDLWLRSAGVTDSAALRAMAPGVDLPKVTAAKTAKVEKTVAVRSTPMGGRTWQVTVAATLVLPPVAPQGDSSAQAAPQSSPQTPAPRAGVSPQGTDDPARVVRYFAVQVSMVRSAGSGGAPDSLVVTGAPAQVSAPAALAEKDPATKTYGSQVTDGPLRDTVSGFLTAYLSGVGDSTRYLSPGARIPAPGTAAYSKVALTNLMAASAVPASPQDGAVLDVQAGVLASDGTGDWPLEYPLRLTARAGRWEISVLAPAGTAPGSSPSSVSSPGAVAPSTTTNGASR
ncbi:hypothetical protein ACFXPX_05075 [Kitasatospora sp. NPDC059146]|uniref:hypothetical protein n=1 Tax=unclassified Kitasatospora TaxID=2633591 RepID=UPI0036A2C940